jgi:lactoylglutathione lyase
MILKKLTPNLMVRRVQDTIDWYREVLGFEAIAKNPAEGEPEWAMLKSGEVVIMVQSRESLAKDAPALEDVPIAASLTLYIDMAGLTEIRGKLEGKVEIVHDLHETFYGTRVIYFRDCNGYILAFSEAKEPS